MKRGKPLERRTPLKQSPWGANKTDAQKARDDGRKAQDFMRKYHSVERVMFVKHALHCGVTACGRTPCENAHIDGEGTGRKSGYRRIAPLCALHHRTSKKSLHNIGRAPFEYEWGTDLEQLAAWTDERWQVYGPQWIAAVKADGRWEAMTG